MKSTLAFLFSLGFAHQIAGASVLNHRQVVDMGMASQILGVKSGGAEPQVIVHFCEPTHRVHCDGGSKSLYRVKSYGLSTGKETDLTENFYKNEKCRISNRPQVDRDLNILIFGCYSDDGKPTPNFALNLNSGEYFELKAPPLAEVPPYPISNTWHLAKLQDGTDVIRNERFYSIKYRDPPAGTYEGSLHSRHSLFSIQGKEISSSTKFWGFSDFNQWRRDEIKTFPSHDFPFYVLGLGFWGPGTDRRSLKGIGTEPSLARDFHFSSRYLPETHVGNLVRFVEGTLGFVDYHKNQSFIFQGPDREHFVAYKRGESFSSGSLSAFTASKLSKQPVQVLVDFEGADRERYTQWKFLGGAFAAPTKFISLFAADGDEWITIYESELGTSGKEKYKIKLQELAGLHFPRGIRKGTDHRYKTMYSSAYLNGAQKLIVPLQDAQNRVSLFELDYAKPALKQCGEWMSAEFWNNGQTTDRLKDGRIIVSRIAWEKVNAGFYLYDCQRPELARHEDWGNKTGIGLTFNSDLDILLYNFRDSGVEEAKWMDFVTGQTKTLPFQTTNTILPIPGTRKFLFEKLGGFVPGFGLQRVMLMEADLPN